MRIGVGIRDLIPSSLASDITDWVQTIVLITIGLIRMILSSCCCMWMTCWW